MNGKKNEIKTIAGKKFWVFLLSGLFVFMIYSIYSIDQKHEQRKRDWIEQQQQIDEINQKLSDIQTEVEMISKSLQPDNEPNERNVIEKEEVVETVSVSEYRNTEQERENEEYTNRGEIRTMHVTCTAYSAGDGMTPGTVMASGKTVYNGAVACNFLPLGSKVRIDGRIYTVEDRCGYNDRIDIYMDSVAECYQFGIRTLQVEIL